MHKELPWRDVPLPKEMCCSFYDHLCDNVLPSHCFIFCRIASFLLASLPPLLDLERELLLFLSERPPLRRSRSRCRLDLLRLDLLRLGLLRERERERCCC